LQKFNLNPVEKINQKVESMEHEREIPFQNVRKHHKTTIQNEKQELTNYFSQQRAKNTRKLFQ